MGVWFTTREAVMAALDISATANAAHEIDDAIAAASQDALDVTRRRLAPWYGTVSIDWPTRHTESWICELGYDTAISLTEVTAAGTALAGWTLEPSSEGPPFTRIEMPRTGAGFTFGTSQQNNVTATGLFGWTDDQLSVGTVDGAITSVATTVTLATASRVGVGSLLSVGDERMIVQGRLYTDTGATLSGALTDTSAGTTVTVSSGASFAAGELIAVDGERMMVTAVTGNTLTVVRAADGTALATHSNGATVSAPRLLSVRRGAQGSTAAAIDDGDAATIWQPNDLVRQYTLAKAIELFEQGRAGWARTAGSGENQRETRGPGVSALRKDLHKAYYPRDRMGAVG